MTFLLCFPEAEKQKDHWMKCHLRALLQVSCARCIANPQEDKKTKDLIWAISMFRKAKIRI